jgi:hypothetical protein
MSSQIFLYIIGPLFQNQIKFLIKKIAKIKIMIERIYIKIFIIKLITNLNYNFNTTVKIYF